MKSVDYSFFSAMITLNYQLTEYAYLTIIWKNNIENLIRYPLLCKKDI